jgi:CBS domain containing-hemolysin-like protein
LFAILPHIASFAPWLAPGGASPDPAVDWTRVDGLGIALAGAALLLAGTFATLRRSLAQSVAERVLAPVGNAAHRTRLESLLGRVDRLTTSATVLETACALSFGVLVLRVVATDGAIGAREIATTLVVCVPVLWFVTDALARGLALRSGGAIVRIGLPLFHALQFPLELLAWSFEKVRRGILRLFGLRDDPEATRQIVAGLREVVEEAEISGKLDATEREIIGNVMEFRDVDVAAVMTPRTEIRAVDVELGVMAAAQELASSGHSRVPVYEGTLDKVIGTVSARDLVQVMAAGPTANADLRSLLHTAYFVPETKRIRELLGELRREKIEVAIVLDEYGGTAGLVTVGDIVGEIVGEIPDEYDEDEPSPLRRLPEGAAEVDATMHVSEVNEALDLDLPEEADYETLGGFVLAQLGHVPQRGEHFTRGTAEFAVVDANDRRVLKVRVKKVPATSAP